MIDTVHKLFEKQVERTPDAVATSQGQRTLTFRELDERANCLARHLIARGIRPGDLVGLAGEHSIELCVAMFGILKSGGAYVLLHGSQPDERLRQIREETRPKLLVAVDRSAQALSNDFPDTVSLESDTATIGRELTTAPAVSVSGDDPVYVQHTSGSTGTPKAVLTLHRSVVNRYIWQWQTYPAQPGEVCSQHPFGPLLHGVRNVVPDPAFDSDWNYLLPFYEREGVSRLIVAPSTLRVLLDTYDDLADRLPAAQLWFSAGEALDAEVANLFHRCLPGRTLVNLYGTTEVTTDATWFETRPNNTEGRVPIGRPLPGVRLHLLDDLGRPVRPGEVGELYIGGVGVTAGYVGRPEPTRQAFVGLQFDVGPVYRTGDLGRCRDDGNYEIHGRADHQIQIRGFRIEPTEVERALREDTVILDAAVRKNGDELVAWVVPRNANGDIDVSSLRSRIAERLPNEMVPSRIVTLASLPKGDSDKIDRLALVAPVDAAIEQQPGSEPWEAELQRIFAGAFRRDHVGLDEHFFDLGGHSLLALAVLAKLEKVSGCRLPVSVFHEAPTIRLLARRVVAEHKA